MKYPVLMILLGALYLSCGTRVGESLCGYTGKRPISIESGNGVLQGYTITFENYIPVIVGGGFEQHTATICNPELLDSINLPTETTKIVFTGKYFNGKDASGKEEVYLYLHDIVPAPRGFDH